MSNDFCDVVYQYMPSPNNDLPFTAYTNIIDGYIDLAHLFSVCTNLDFFNVEQPCGNDACKALGNSIYNLMNSNFSPKYCINNIKDYSIYSEQVNACLNEFGSGIKSILGSVCQPNLSDPTGGTSSSIPSCNSNNNGSGDLPIAPIN